MALEKKTLSFPFAKGMNQKASEKSLKIGELAEVENGVFEKGGQIRKRRGLTIQGNTVPATATVSATTVAAGKQIASYKDEMIVFDGETAYSRATNGEWLNRGDVTGMTIKNEFIRRDPRVKQSNAQYCEASNKGVYAWIEYTPDAATVSYKGYCQIIDTETGSILLDKTEIFTFTKTFTATGTCSSTSGTTVNGSSTHFKTEFAPGNKITISGTTRVVSSVTNDTTIVTTATWAGSESGAVTGDYRDGANTLSFHPYLQVAALGGYAFLVYTDSALVTTVGYSLCNVKYRAINLGSIGSSLVPGSATNILKVPRLYPAFSLDSTINPTVSSGALVAAHKDSNTADEKLTVRYLTQSSGSLSAGAASTYIHDTLGETLEFQAWDGGKTDAEASASVFSVKALHTFTSGIPSSNAANQVAIIFRSQSASSPGTNRRIRVVIFVHALSSVSRSEIVEALASADDDMGALGIGFTTLAIHAYIEKNANTGGHHGQLLVSPFTLKHYTLDRTGADSGTLTTRFQNVSILSDGWNYLNRVYFLVCAVTNSDFLSSCICVVDTTGRVYAKWNLSEPATCYPLEYFERAQTTFHPRMSYAASRISGRNNGMFFCGLSQYDPSQVLQETHMVTWTNITKMTIDMEPTRYLPSVEASGSLMVAGGLLWQYAGDYFKENGFITYPATGQVSVSSGALDVGKYLYQVIYEWQDAAGNAHRSYPSDVIEYTLTSSSGSIAFDVYGLQLTNKKDPDGNIEAKIHIYGTDPDEDAMYLKDTIDMSTGALKYAFEDIGTNLASTPKSKRPVPYVEDGQIANVEPPSCTDIVAHRGRIAVATTANTVMISKPLASGSQAGFTNIPGSQFAISIDNYSHPVTALASNLEHLLIFTANDGYVLSGDGPDVFGQGEFIGPKLFAPGQGCVDGMPTGETPLGVIYKSSHGYYWVQRNLAVSYIGASVEDYNAAAVGSVDTLDARHEIRFLLTGSDTTRILVYNYHFNQWSMATVTLGTMGKNIAATVMNGTYYRLNQSGRLFEESEANFYDTGTSGTQTYAMSVTTGHARYPQHYARARFYRLGLLATFVSDSTVDVAVYNDFSPSASYTKQQEFDASNGNNQEPTLLKLRLNKQKLRALQVKVTVTANAEGMKLEGLAYEVGESTATFKEGTERGA